MAKLVQAGPVSLSVSAAGGVVTLAASVSGSLGGGAAADLLQGSAQLSAQLGAQQAVDLLMGLAESAFPSAQGLLKMLQAGLDAELAKVVV